MNRFVPMLTSAALALLASSAAHAESKKSKFTSFINNTCTLTTIVDGNLAQDGFVGMVLSTKQNGGYASEVAAVTTAKGFMISVTGPTGWTVSAGAPQPTNFVTTYFTTGATVLPEGPGTTARKLNYGTNMVRTHLVATRTTAVPFINGNYETVVTVRCE